MTSRRRLPHQERSADTVEAILAAARRLLAEHDPSRLTVRRVADAAGTAAPTIYRYFDDLDQVIDAVLAEHTEAATEAVRTALGRSRHRTVAGVFQLVVDTYLELYATRPELALAWHSPELAARHQRIEAASDLSLATALAHHLADRGLIAGPDPTATALITARWNAAGSLIGALLRAGESERPALEAELRSLVRHFAHRTSARSPRR